MHILFATPTPMYRNQGDAVHVAEVSQSLISLGATVTLIAAGEPIAQLEGVNYINCGQVVPGHFIKRLYSYGKHTFTILRHVIKHAKDCDVLYTRDAVLGVSLSLLKPYLNIPFIFEVNGLRGAEKNMHISGGLGNVFSKLFTLCEQKTASSATAIICVTTGLRQALITDYGIKKDIITVIDNGVNLTLFSPPSDNAETDALKTALNIYDKDIILFLGALKPWIDFKTLINGVDLIKGGDRNGILLIVGTGEMKSTIETLIKNMKHPERVMLTGAVPYSSVPAYIALADVCTMPFTVQRNKKIGLSPLKLYAYLACGKPIIATYFEDFQFLSDHQIGTLTKPSNPEAFAKAITYWLNQKQIPNHVERQARTYAEENCGWDKTAKEVLAVCKGVIEKK